jgi:hypothetical protein
MHIETHSSQKEDGAMSAESGYDRVAFVHSTKADIVEAEGHGMPCPYGWSIV